MGTDEEGAATGWEDSRFEGSGDNCDGSGEREGEDVTATPVEIPARPEGTGAVSRESEENDEPARSEKAGAKGAGAFGAEAGCVP